MRLLLALLLLAVIAPPAVAQSTATPTAEQPAKPPAKNTAKNTAKKPAKKQKKQPPFQWVNKPGKLPARVTHHTFDSAIAGEPVGYLLYQPPGYAADPAKRFPVVYYLHGGRPGSEGKGLGLVPTIDSLMSDGRVPEALVVFVNGGPVSHYNTPAAPDIKQAETRGADVFITELIPHIDATYRTIADRSGRVLTGFSQGGRGTARLAFRYPELFARAAPGGGGFATEKRISESDGYEHPRLKFADGDNAYDLLARYAAARAEGTAPELPLLFYVGDEGFNYRNNLAYMDRLTELGVPYEKIVVPGVGHNARAIYEQQGEAILTFLLR